MKFHWLLFFVVAYAASSLVHHVHNAELLDQYPNMPAWLSPVTVYGAWLVSTAVGVAGYLAFRRGYRRIGLALLFLYGCYGLDSLVHYALAPVSAHTAAMHMTIWLEVAGAACLLIACGVSLRRPDLR